jgi:type IV pilus assembly protein PilM
MQFKKGLQDFSRTFARAFPTPKLINPAGAGIDISDASIKWLVLEPYVGQYRVAGYGEEPLPDGVVVSGAVQNVGALGAALKKVKSHLGAIPCAHAALPEEAAYVFEMHTPEGVSRDEALHLIEFEFEGRVPITPADAVFDFDVIQKHDDGGQDIGVAVFPRELAESYVAAFEQGGISLLSLELEARSIARATSSGAPDEPITLLVDFGRERTGFAVLKHGIPIFTSTVEVGGDAITKALMEKLSLSAEAAIQFRNEQGLIPEGADKTKGLDAIAGVASALSDEVARHYHYWDTRRNERGERMTPVGQVILVGGSANLKGLGDYIMSRVQAPTLTGDVWRRVCDFDTYVPPIERRVSLQYATAIGLALRSYPV